MPGQVGSSGAVAVVATSQPFTLTDAEIKTVTGGTSLFQLLPAPGANKMYGFVEGWVFTNFAGGTYTGIDETDAALDFRVGANQAVSTFAENNASGRSSFSSVFQVDGVKVQFAPASRVTQGTLAEAMVSTESLANQPLYLEIYNGDGVLIGGHASNTLTGVVLYTVIDL